MCCQDKGVEVKPDDCGCSDTCDNSSSRPVRYYNGEVHVALPMLNSSGFGHRWGHTLSYSNRVTNPAAGLNGSSWFTREQPQLFQTTGIVQEPGHPPKVVNRVAVIQVISEAVWFQENPTTHQYQGMFFNAEKLVHLSSTKEFLYFNLRGQKLAFFDFSSSIPLVQQGRLKSWTDADGRVTYVDYWANGLMRRFRQEDATSGESSTYEYQYVNPSSSSGSSASSGAVGINERLEVVTLVVKGTPVRRLKFAYYGAGDSHGGMGDLKRVTLQMLDDEGWQDLQHTLFRYYLSGDAHGVAHGMKFQVLPESYQRMVNAGLSPETATDAQMANYADYYFEYDGSRRVTRETVDAGSQTFLFEYVTSSNPDGYNSWKVRTTETLPDGSQNIVYTNAAGASILKILKQGDNEWYSFHRYKDNGLVEFQASSSAVTGYDESYPDLLHRESDGTYEFLKDNDGLIEVYEYFSTNHLKSRGVRKGQLGSVTKLQELSYTARTVSGVTVYVVAEDKSYQSNVSGGSDPSTTSYSYEWYSGTFQMKQRQTTLPVIPIGQNGSGVANTRAEAYDAYGLVTWQKNERGFLTNYTFDIVTGAIVQQIDDVDTSIVSGAPSGWTTPTGGGLNLVTNYQSDLLGRTTQVLGPEHEIDLSGTATMVRRASWSVYQDLEFQQWSGSGYATGSSPSYSYTLINPVQLSQFDHAGRTIEQMSAVRSSTSGKLSPSDSFPQSSYVRWSTSHYNDESQLTHTRQYHLIPSSGEGTSGTNYEQTDYGYDEMDRQNRIKTPGGTISRTVYDVRSLVTETWVGTDDTGATDTNPAGSGAPNNMVKVQENEYDDGDPGGDGNLTQQTAYASASDTRVTTFAYDFRNRRVSEQGEEAYFAEFFYDNLDRVTQTDRHNTDADGNLIGRNETKYDNQGRVYQSYVYAVDPSTGDVGNSLVSNSWYDPVGNLLKQLPAGSQLFQKSVYDSLNRLTTQYSAYDTDETDYADAGDVDDDTVMQQSESTYDDASNLIQQVSRLRFHNATGTGPLTDPDGSEPKARVSYAVSYPDALGRVMASVNYGTNGADAFTRPDTIPARSDTVLVNSTAYNDAGEAWKTVDPQGTENRSEFNDAGQTKKTIENYVSGGTDADQNRTTEFTYNADGKLETLTVKNDVTGDQVTTWDYGTTLSDSGVASNELLRAKVYPDSSTDRVEYGYNRLGQVRESTDQNGTVRALDYDKLGRLIHDRVTTLGTDVDGTVRRISRSYEIRGMVESVTTYDNATVGSGSVVGEVKSEYNDFSQLVREYQSQDGAVNPSTTPKVEYAYADGSANTIRRISQTYPDGREVEYDYGTPGGMNDVLSRVEALVEGATEPVRYKYLGLGEIVEAEYNA